jgi:hypothetical protein
MEGMRGSGAAADEQLRVTLEILEVPVAVSGYPENWRCQFRRETVQTLREEFGDHLILLWEQPVGEALTAPLILIDGHEMWVGRYPPARVLRSSLASLLALKTAGAFLAAEAAADLQRLQSTFTSWQDGLLEWAVRRGEDPPSPTEE